jgi:phosphatidate cytidylyltransferase
MLALLFLGPAWAWLAFVLIAAVLGSIELFSMTHGGDRVATVVGAIAACSVASAVYFFSNEPRLLATVLLVMPLVGIALTLARLGELRTAALRLVASGFGPIYIGVGFGAVAALRLAGEPEGAGFVVLAMGLAWLSDTGGYFAGRAFGKRKLYAAVSPKKTVEGAVGGVACVVAGALVIRWLVVPSMPLSHTLGLAVVGAVAGQLGDLGESVLKRSIGVKDSGSVVPGHGGMLDRVDALIITGPLTYAYLLWR